MYDRVGGDCGEPLSVSGTILERIAEGRGCERPRERASDAARDINAAARVEGERDIAGHAAEEAQKYLDRAKRFLMPDLRIGDHLVRGQCLAAERAVQACDAGTG